MLLVYLVHTNNIYYLSTYFDKVDNFSFQGKVLGSLLLAQSITKLRHHCMHALNLLRPFSLNLYHRWCLSLTRLSLDLSPGYGLSNLYSHDYAHFRPFSLFELCQLAIFYYTSHLLPFIHNIAFPKNLYFFNLFIFWILNFTWLCAFYPMRVSLVSWPPTCHVLIRILKVIDSAFAPASSLDMSTIVKCCFLQHFF